MKNFKLLVLIITLTTALSGCGDPYTERTTPDNCACGDWQNPTNNKVYA